MYNAIINIAKVTGIQLSEEIETDTSDIKAFPNLAYMGGVLKGTQLPTTLRKDQFINKMIGVEEKPKEINRSIGCVDMVFKNEGDIKFVQIPRGKWLFTKTHLKQMIDTLEEMK